MENNKKIMWKLFDLEIEEIISTKQIDKAEENYNEEYEYITKSDEEITVSDLLTEVYYVTIIKDLVSKGENKENLEKLTQYVSMIHLAMKNVIKIEELMDVKGELLEPTLLTELTIEHYRRIRNAKPNEDTMNIKKLQQTILNIMQLSYNITQEKEKKIIESFDKINRNLRLEKKNGQNLTNLLILLDDKYKKMYEIYKLSKTNLYNRSKPTKRDSVTEIVLEDQGKNRIITQADIYVQKVRNEQNSIFESMNFQKNIDIQGLAATLKIEMEKTKILEKNLIYGRKCFAIAKYEDKKIIEELISFSGIYDSIYSQDISILNHSKSESQLQDAIKKIKHSERFKNSIVVRTSPKVKYYFEGQRSITLNDFINVYPNELKDNQRMFSCVERKILAHCSNKGRRKTYKNNHPLLKNKNLNVEIILKIYSRYSPCYMCELSIKNEKKIDVRVSFGEKIDSKNNTNMRGVKFDDIASDIYKRRY